MHYNTRVGEGVAMEVLEQGDDRMVLTIGLRLRRSARIPNAHDSGAPVGGAVLRGQARVNS